ncbi:MAG: hypothetical protein J2P43_16330, partial [Candidatus Dormibacteraeota bacterium]|nr:hypothetical protein [Candidatus Dormibacteraeota bacterium]
MTEGDGGEGDRLGSAGGGGRGSTPAGQVSSTLEVTTMTLADTIPLASRSPRRATHDPGSMAEVVEEVT